MLSQLFVRCLASPAAAGLTGADEGAARPAQDLVGVLLADTDLLGLSSATAITVLL
jgi:hypothetical protein